MTGMQRVVVVLALILAVLVGVVIVTSVLEGKGGSAEPSARATASPAASLPPTATPSAAPSESAAPSPSASATPRPTPTPGPAATIRFVQLALDAATDTAGATRTITFTGQPGPVTVTLATESGGNSSACLFADGKQLACRTAASGTLTGTLAKSAAVKVTLRGAESATPVVDVTLTFPAQRPKVTIANARFDGVANAAHNGLQAVATPRAKGYFHVTASWGGHPFLYEVDLIEQGGPGLKFIPATTGATNVSQGFAVAPPNAWMIVLKNAEAGFGATPLSATFTWP